MPRERYMNDLDHRQLVPDADGRPVVVVTKFTDFAGREARLGEKYPLKHLCEHPGHTEGLSACIHLRDGKGVAMEAYCFLFPGEWRFENEHDLYNVEIHKYKYSGHGNAVQESGETYVTERVNRMEIPMERKSNNAFSVADDTPL